MGTAAGGASERASAASERGPGALDRGLAILDHLSRARSCTTADLAKELGLSRSTAYRLVERLRAQGWLSLDPVTGHVRLGPTAMHLANAAVASTSLLDAATPALRKLVDLTQETVSLAVPNGLTMVFIHRERGPRPAAVTAELGAARPMHITSLGRAYLAALPEQRLEEALVELVRSPDSPVSAATVSDLHAEVVRTRERGYAQDIREFDASSVCCGAAIHDHTGLPVAAISVAGVAERMEPAIVTYGPVVAKVCAELSAGLGYLPPKG